MSTYVIEMKTLQMSQMYPFEPTQTPVAFIQFTLQVLHRLFKYVFYISERVYSFLFLESWFEIMRSVPI